MKNFQIAYSPNAWKSERKTWRAVIYLNLVRSIRRILAILDESHVAAGGQSYNFNTAETLEENLNAEEDAAHAPTTLDGTENGPGGRPRTNSNSTSAMLSSNGSLAGSNLGPLPSHILELTLRLSPLGLVEQSLIGALSSEDPSQDDFEATSLGPKDLLKGKANGREHALSATQWKRTLKTKISGGKDSGSLFGRKKNNRDSSSSGSNGSHRGGRPNNNLKAPSMAPSMISEDDSVAPQEGEATLGEVMDMNVQEDILGTLQACQDDIIRLWKDPYVRDVLRKKRFRPQDASGLYVIIRRGLVFYSSSNQIIQYSFLDDIPRLLDDRYLPSDVDVLNARLKTIGVIEHSFTFDRGSERGVSWTIYDVGGSAFISTNSFKRPRRYLTRLPPL